jgi:hypothetical protein
METVHIELELWQVADLADLLTRLAPDRVSRQLAPAAQKVAHALYALADKTGSVVITTKGGA